MNPADSANPVGGKKFLGVEEPLEDPGNHGVVHQGQQPFPVLVGLVGTGADGMPVEHPAPVFFEQGLKRGTFSMMSGVTISVAKRGIRPT
jgi:hypothetical protein